MSNSRIFLTVFSVFAVSTAWPSRGHAAGGNEVFLTTAEQRTFGTGSDAETRWVPTKQKIGFAWSDQPFAIHVPFHAEVERDDEGRSRSKTYKAWLELRGLEFKDEGGDERTFDIKLVRKGLYRFDGQNSTDEFYFLGSQEELGCPGRLPREGKLGYWLVYDPRRLSTGGELFEYHDGLWKYFGARIRCKLKVEVHEVKALGQDGFGNTRYEKTKKANEQEFEFTLCQNGWRVKGFSQKKAGPWQASDSYKSQSLTDRGASQKGTSLINPFRYVEQRRRNPQTTTDLDFILQFSTPIWDHQHSSVGAWVRWPIDKSNPSVGGCELMPYRHTADERGQPVPVEYAVDGPTRRSFNFSKNEEKQEKYYHNTFKVRPARKGTQERTIDPDWTPNRPIDSHTLFTFDLRFGFRQADGTYPTKRFEVIADRLSDFYNNRTGERETTTPRPVEEEPDDGYVAWWEEHRQLVVKTIAAIRLNTMLLKVGAREKQRIQWKQLSLQRQFVGSFDFYSEPGRDDLIGSVIGVVRDAYGGEQVTRTEGLEALTAESLKYIRDEQKSLRARLTHLRVEQKDLIGRVINQIDEIIAHYSPQIQRSHKRRKEELASDRQYWMDQKQIIEMQLYDSAGLVDELPSLIDRIGFKDTAVRHVAKFMRAKALLAMAKRQEQLLWFRVLSRQSKGVEKIESTARVFQVEALMLLREVVGESGTVASADAVVLSAQEELTKLEITFLNMIAKKLETEKRLDQRELAQYMKSRGFPLDRPVGGWSDFNEWRQSYGIGVTGYVCTLFGNKQAYLAQSVDIISTEAAMYQVALVAAKSLRRQGLSLKEIASITPERVREKLYPVKDPHEPVDKWPALKLAADIRKTFRLPDLKLLVSDGDETEFESAFRTAYYTPLETDYYGWEAKADYLSFTNILSWYLPTGMVVKIGGRWQSRWIWRSSNHEAARIAAQTNRAAPIMLTRDWLIETCKLQKLADKLNLRPIQAALRRDFEMLEEVRKASRLRYGVNMASRMALMSVFYGVAPQVIKEYVPGGEYSGPVLQIFVETLAQLIGHGDASTALAKVGTDFHKIRPIVIDQQARLVRLHQNLETRSMYINEMGRLVKRIGSNVPRGTTLPAPTTSSSLIEMIRAMPPKNVRYIIGEKWNEDFLHMMRPIPNAVERGSANAATLRIAACNRLINEQRALIQTAARQAEFVLKHVPQSSPEPTLPLVNSENRCFPPIKELNTPIPFDLKSYRPDAQGNQLLPESNDVFTYRNEKMYWLEQVGDNKSLKLGSYHAMNGDLAFRRLDEPKALAKYREMKSTLANANKPERRAITELVEKRIEEVSAAQLCSKELQQQRSRLAPLGVSREITDSEIKTIDTMIELQLLGRTSDVLVQPSLNTASANPVFYIKKEGQIAYVFKVLDDMEEIIGEELGWRFFDHVKVPAPAVRRAELELGPFEHLVKADDPRNGRLVTLPDPNNPGTTMQLKKLSYSSGRRLGVLSRYVPGVEMWDLPLDLFMALRPDYARQYPVRVVLGDPDGHVRNFRFASDARLYSFDTDWAHLLRDGGKKFRGDRAWDNQVQMMKRVLGKNSAARAVPIHGWANHMDSMVRVKEVNETIGILKRWYSDKEGKTLKGVFREVYRYPVIQGGRRVRHSETQELVWKVNEQHVNEAYEVLGERLENLQPLLKAHFWVDPRKR